MSTIRKFIDASNFAELPAEDFNQQPFGQKEDTAHIVLAIRAVLTLGANDPPADAKDDDRHLIGDTPTGAWADHAYQLTRRNSLLAAGWEFITLPDGERVFNLAERKLYEMASGAPAEAPSTTDGPGIVKIYAGAVVPSGYLLCDGNSYARSAYPALFAKIGTAYGAENGHSFSVPDMRGRAPFGVGPNADLDARGANEGLDAADRDPWHSHEADGTIGAAAGIDVSPNSGATAFNAVPYLAFQFIIKT